MYERLGRLSREEYKGKIWSEQQKANQKTNIGNPQREKPTQSLSKKPIDNLETSQKAQLINYA